MFSASAAPLSLIADARTSICSKVGKNRLSPKRRRPVNTSVEPTALYRSFFRRRRLAAAHLVVGGPSRFRLLNLPNNSPDCFAGRVPVASGVGGGLGASPAGGCRGPSGVGRSSEASPQVGVCKNRSFQSDAVPSMTGWAVFRSVNEREVMYLIVITGFQNDCVKKRKFPWRTAEIRP